MSAAVGGAMRDPALMGRSKKTRELWSGYDELHHRLVRRISKGVLHVSRYVDELPFSRRGPVWIAALAVPHLNRSGQNIETFHVGMAVKRNRSARIVPIMAR